MASTGFKPRMAMLGAIGALALVASACGGDGATDGDHDESFTFGEPAAADDTDRTIEIDANDDFSFSPDTVEIAADETVTFVVTNTGEMTHEFVLGDTAHQEEHEAMMQEGGEEMMHDEANAISIGPGETHELTWHFTEAGELEMGCHEPGHYAGGMKGTITVS